MRRFRDYRITWIGTQRNVGQIRAIDLGYSLVETQAIFHLEDDWEFYAPGFIEKSAAILSADRSCLQIWLRALDDTNGHPLDPGVDRVGGVDVRRLTFGYLGEWHGFSFNPGLRRTADYRRLGDFRRHTQFARREHGAPEMIISTLYRDLGMHAAILADNDGRGYVHHIGEGRSLRPST